MLPHYIAGMLSAHDINQLRSGRCGDPFALLGLHRDQGGQAWVRAMLPGATAVVVIGALDARRLGTLLSVHADGVFEGPVALAAADVGQASAYRLHISWADGTAQVAEDPYRFGPVLGQLDAWLLAEGTHLRPIEVLGASPGSHEGVAGTRFAVWAPNASRVSVVGDFNHWDGRRHPMRLRRECGVWELFLPGVAAGARYKFELLGPQGELLPQKADPMARAAELRPATASVVAALPAPVPRSSARRAANALGAPISIYEVHLGSWRRKPEDGNRWLNWDELADTLIPYAVGLGFSHVELLPSASTRLTARGATSLWGCTHPPPVLVARPVSRVLLKKPTLPAWACCWTGCRPTSRLTRTAWATLTAPTCTNTPTPKRATTPTGTR